MSRRAVGNHFNRSKYIEAPDGKHDQRKQDRPPDGGKGYGEKFSHAPRPVQRSHLIQLLRHCLQRGQKYHHIPADSFPYAKKHGYGQPSPPGIKPPDIPAGHMNDIGKEIIQHSLRIKHVFENQGGNDPGRDNRQIIQHTESNPEVADAVDKQRCKQAEQHLGRNRHQRIYDGIHKYRMEIWIPEYFPIVGETDKFLIQYGAKIPLEKAHN